MSNTNDIAALMSRDLVVAIAHSVSHNETARLTTTLDISTVEAFAADHADNVDSARESDGSYDVWGWNDDQAEGEMLWRLNVTIVTNEYHYATDAESGVIEAASFDDAKQQLEAMLTPAARRDGAWGWVEDTDGYRYEIGENN